VTELVSSYNIKASRTLKNSSFKDYKIQKKITQFFLSYGSLVQILTDNNGEERKIASKTGVETTMLRSKKE
jgi:hypothetical protein